MPTAYRLLLTNYTIVVNGIALRATEPVRKSTLQDMGASSRDGKFYRIAPLVPKHFAAWHIIRFGRNYRSYGRVKCSPRPDKIDRRRPVIANIGSHKRHARRTGRRLAKQYLRREIFADVEGGYNSHYLPGLNSWDVS